MIEIMVMMNQLHEGIKIVMTFKLLNDNKVSTLSLYLYIPKSNKVYAFYRVLRNQTCRQFYNVTILFVEKYQSNLVKKGLK